MKRIFFLIAMSCMMLAQLPVQAQSMKNRKALLAAIDTIVRKYSHEPAHQNIIEENIKAFEKDADFIASIARCYFNYVWVEEDGVRRQKRGTAEPEKAYKYIYRALHMDTACVKAYLIAADIEQNTQNREAAGEWFRKGLEQCPNSQELAIAYSTYKAADNLEDAIEELKKKGQSDPSFNTNLEIARLHIRMNDMTGQPHYLTDAGPYFQKCRLTDLTEDDLKIFLIGLNSAQLWQDLKTASEYGMNNYPGVYSITSYYFQSLVNLKEWEQALKAYQLLQKTDKYKVDQRNEAFLGNVYRGLKRYDDAMAQYEKVINAEDKSGVSIANNGIKATMEEQLKVYIQEDRYDEAAAFYKGFVERRKAEGKLDGSIYNNYANIFIQQSNKLDGAAKVEAFQKAGAIYKEWIANETIVDNIAIAHGRLMLLSQYIFGVEQNMNVIYEAAHDTELWYDSLSESDKTIHAAERNYLTALDLIIRYYFQTMSGTKPTERQTLKSYGDKILDLATDNGMLTRVQQMYDAWKIK